MAFIPILLKVLPNHIHSTVQIFVHPILNWLRCSALGPGNISRCLSGKGYATHDVSSACSSGC
eukprot:6112403-Amphidinium_carterae.1